MKTHRFAGMVLAGLGLAVSAPSAHALTINGASGSKAASVDFTKSGTNLIVTLANTGTGDNTAPSDILTAVFFDIVGAPALSVTGGSAIAELVVNDPTAANNGANKNVGSEWAYSGAIASGVGIPGNATHGLSSTGIGLFGPADRFDTVGNLQGPDSPNGVQYGITSDADNLATANGGLSGNGLIRNQVVMTLTGLPAAFVVDSSTISNIYFLYGTALPPEGGFPGGPCEPGTPGCGGGGPDPDPSTPEPVTASMGLMSLIGLGFATRRRRA
ncbi:MAG: hypothetical protein K8S99_05350 [Planctomycetes bacterium]|nr:hypothetical protein [Planctomycetota bacterium]